MSNRKASGIACCQLTEVQPVSVALFADVAVSYLWLPRIGVDEAPGASHKNEIQKKKSLSTKILRAAKDEGSSKESEACGDQPVPVRGSRAPAGNYETDE
jgi:hypothetical protein